MMSYLKTAIESGEWDCQNFTSLAYRQRPIRLDINEPGTIEDTDGNEICANHYLFIGPLWICLERGNKTNDEPGAVVARNYNSLAVIKPILIPLERGPNKEPVEAASVRDISNQVL